MHDEPLDPFRDDPVDPSTDIDEPDEPMAVSYTHLTLPTIYSV